MDYKILINRKIIDILIGDEKVYENYGFPYLRGADLCDLCCEFGLPKTYYWGNTGPNMSRWEYMRDLMKFLCNQGRIPELLSRLSDIKYFEDLSNLGSPEQVHSTHSHIINSALSRINVILMRANMRLFENKGRFVLADVNSEPVFNTPKMKVINRQYIRDLPERIKDDLTHKDYDSVITKSRTLIEEVLIFIIEKLTHERFNSKGNLLKIYQEATELLNMRQNKEWDVRVNELLGGLHKIVSSISTMRNINSDAHGVGAGRITIKEREAIMVANSSMMLAEYWLAVFEDKH